MNKLINWLQLAGAYVRLNFKSHLEYRGAFLSQAIAMAVNDGIWIVFWNLFFTRFPVLHGWTQREVMEAWAICAAGFGLAASIFGNTQFMAKLIARGQLDAWLLYPRALLPHFALGRMSASAVGDVVFGYGLFFAFVHPDFAHSVMFIAFTLSAATLFTAFFILTGSLSFYVGNAEVLAEQWFFSLITFGTYPATLFEGRVKLLLYTLIPAGFVAYMPVEALQKLSLVQAVYTIIASMAFLAIGVSVFYIGLRRYESGSLMEMRG